MTLIGSAARRDGTVQTVHAYRESADFPRHDYLILERAALHGTERVPITEDIWRAAGIALGYRFKKKVEA